MLGKPASDAQAIFRAEGVALMFDEIKTSLADFGVHFDVYFAEKDLHDKGELTVALARLRQMGHVYEADGATWIRTTGFGDDKDRVYVRSSGDFTYYRRTTARTTWTSEHAASTRSLSCLAPTTMATLAAYAR